MSEILIQDLNLVIFSIDLLFEVMNCYLKLMDLQLELLGVL